MLQALLERKVLREMLVTLDPLVLLDLKEYRVTRVVLEPRVPQALKGVLGQLAPLALKALLVSGTSIRPLHRLMLRLARAARRLILGRGTTILLVKM